MLGALLTHEEWIQVDFGAEVEVIIHQLQIGGFEGDLGTQAQGPFFVTRFRVEHATSPSEFNSLLQTSVGDGSMLSREGTSDTTVIHLPSPIVARVLKIVAVNFNGLVPCARMEAFSCI